MQPKDKLQSGSFTWGHLDRNYLYYIPSTISDTEKVPMIMALHGFTSTPEETARIYAPILFYIR
ncbi:MAG: hypothetical protein ACLFQV_11395 [Vulcanimicrobiota bacterium]